MWPTAAQVQLMRANAMATPLLEEVDAELAQVWRFILEREVEAPERFQVICPVPDLVPRLAVACCRLVLWSMAGQAFIFLPLPFPRHGLPAGFAAAAHPLTHHQASSGKGVSGL